MRQHCPVTQFNSCSFHVSDATTYMYNLHDPQVLGTSRINEIQGIGPAIYACWLIQWKYVIVLVTICTLGDNAVGIGG